ncbi:MAG TPA: MBG domain-containing protein, partial [Chloroflexota bacterium]
ATATNGSGTVTVAQYAANPAPASNTFSGNGAYFDVHVAPGSTFTSLTIQDCSTNSGSQAYWYSPTGGWTLASNQSYNASTGCITITANSTGTPTITQLTGTYFTFAKATATVALGSLSQTYDGTAKNATATTTPAGLSVGFVYSQNGAAVTSPINAGSYAVTATVNDANYQGSATDTLVINKAVTSIALGNLSQTYDGTAKAATATTTPTGLSGVTLSYSQGSATVASPTNAGSYAVVASLNNANYQAPNATGTLVIAKADQNITFGALASKTYGDPAFTVSATASSGLPVSFSATGNCTVTGSSVTITGAGSCTITAAQAGNTNYNAAANVIQSFAIAKATPVIAWANPADIVLSTTLGTSQLNASSSFQSSPLAGAFTYTPAAGAVLGVGPQTLSVTFAPTDSADFNSSTTTVTINVRYASGSACDGAAGHTILPPINADGTSVFKQGNTVPAKFRVCDANGTSIGSPGVVTSFTLVQITSGTVVQTVTATVDSTTPDSAFHWDATGQQWIFNVSTSGLSANSTYTYRILLNDTTTITMTFGLK